jgi:hypothetical protein
MPVHIRHFNGLVFAKYLCESFFFARIFAKTAGDILLRQDARSRLLVAHSCHYAAAIRLMPVFCSTQPHRPRPRLDHQPDDRQPDPGDPGRRLQGRTAPGRDRNDLGQRRHGAAPGEHDLLWGIHAATAWAALSALSLASPGYHRSKRGRNVPSSVRVRVCSSRCAPRFVHCIC